MKPRWRIIEDKHEVRCSVCDEYYLQERGDGLFYPLYQEWACNKCIKMHGDEKIDEIFKSLPVNK